MIKASNTAMRTNISAALERIGSLDMPYVEGVGVVGPDSTELPFLKPPWWQRKGATYVGRYPAYKCASSQEHAIYTGFLFECASLAIINRRQGWHYLAHIFYTVTSNELYNNLIGRIALDGSDIYVLPGCQELTRGVIGRLLLGLAFIEPTLLNKINFVHFPKATPWRKGAYKFVSYRGKVGYFDRDLWWKSRCTFPIEPKRGSDDYWMTETPLPKKGSSFYCSFTRFVENLSDNHSFE